MARKKAVEHSKNFEKVKTYFDTSRWSEHRVHEAVIKSWITSDEYKEITGTKYVATTEE